MKLQIQKENDPSLSNDVQEKSNFNFQYFSKT